MASMWQRIFFGGSRTTVAPRAQPRASTMRTPATAPRVSADVLPRMSRAQVEDRFQRFVLDLPDADIDSASAPEQATLKRLELLSTRFDMRSLPRLPSVLPQLLRTLKNDDAGCGQLAKLVGRDPMMVGEVMRVTSSVYYRSAQPITSLQQAVVLLGQDGLRQVLTQHVMKPILQANAGALGHAAGVRLWDHAERCAHACAWLGKNNGCDSFEAYLAGIICRTGTGAVVRLLDQLIADVNVPLSPGFLDSCARLAGRLSLQAAQHWELPARVIEAMAEIQDPANPPSTALGKALSAADLLAMAQLLAEHDRIAADIDLSQGDDDPFPPALLARCQQDLRRQFTQAKTIG
jgi:HD-like signal output (HDOD) protein